MVWYGVDGLSSSVVWCQPFFHLGTRKALNEYPTDKPHRCILNSYASGETAVSVGSFKKLPSIGPLTIRLQLNKCISVVRLWLNFDYVQHDSRVIIRPTGKRIKSKLFQVKIHLVLGELEIITTTEVVCRSGPHEWLKHLSALLSFIRIAVSRVSVFPFYDQYFIFRTQVIPCPMCGGSHLYTTLGRYRQFRLGPRTTVI